jgi:hypothetical protein
MDQELLDLIARLNPEGDATPLSDEELADLRGRVAAILGEINRDAPTADDLTVAAEGAATIRAIDSEIATRSTAAADRAAALAAELDGIELPAAQEAEEETEPVEETVDAEAETVEVETTEAEQTEALEPVAAAARPQLPTISRLAHRAPKRVRPVPTATETVAGPARPVLTASADMGLPMGEPVDVERWAVAAERKIRSIMSVNSPDGDGERITLGTVRFEYPQERQLTADAGLNAQRINDAAGPRALAASGGICGPVGVSYDVVGVAVADRPVRDGMVQFNAARGGLRYVLPHTLSAVTTDAPAGLWTQSTDASPGASTKAHATYVCQSVQEAYVDAVTSIVQFGNFQARYFPEQVDQYLQTADAVHARLAEATLLAAMTSGSTAVTAGTNGSGETGAASEYLAEIDRAVAGYRNRHRMAPESPLHLMYPEWFEDAMRADLARELPGNSGGQSERLAVTDAQIDAFFRVRNINVSTYLDSPTSAAVNQNWVVQGVGNLLPWPTKMISYLFHEASWMFLDGGELNLGMVRDSTLNATNNFQMFSETFEKAIQRGHESLVITFDFCAHGGRAATIDTSLLCSSGS